MKKVVSIMILSVFLAISLFAGCTSKTAQTDQSVAPDATETASTSSTEPTTEKSEEKTTVQFWHSMGSSNGEYLDACIKAFNEAHDDIEVVATYQGSYKESITKVQEAVASGTAPDIYMVERAYVQMFAESEVLTDLSSYMESSGMEQNDFVEGLMGHSVFDGKLVSLPFNRSTPILHINKTMLEEHNLEIPQTWEQLKTVANTLAKEENGEFVQYGVVMPYDTWYPIAMITQANGKFFNDEGTSIGFYDNGVGQKVFSFLTDLQSTGALYYAPAQDSGSIAKQMFVGGKVGLLYQSTGSIGGISELVDFDYVTAFLPKDEKYANPTGGGNICMFEASENKDAAWEFIHWMITDSEGSLAFILKSGYMPYTKAMAESDELLALWAEEPNRKTAYDQLQYAVDTNLDVAWPEVMNEFFSAMQAIMYDGEDIDSILKTFKDQAEMILAQS